MIYRREIINRKDRPPYADIVRQRSVPGALETASATADNSESSNNDLRIKGKVKR